MTQKGSALALDAKVVWSPERLDDMPYAPVIERFMGREFPQLSTGEIEDVLEAVIEEFLASKQFRVGPRPNPESLVLMREIVRRSIDRNEPVPILIPAAALKVPIGESLDIAELSALRVLGCLQARVQQHYPAGVKIRIRLEDLTELVISQSLDLDMVKRHIKQYDETLLNLVTALGYAHFIELWPESALLNQRWSNDVTDEEFTRQAKRYETHFIDYLDNRSSASEFALTSLGWSGGVSKAMTNYLVERYQKLYPGTTPVMWTQMTAQYLSAILARRRMQLSGGWPEGQLELSFAPPLPDTPLVSPRVYYRTAPRSETSLHMPFWNAKGYLLLGKDGSTKIKLGAWDGEYERGQLEISGHGATAVIRADYVQED